jgi:hypothetical protein
MRDSVVRGNKYMIACWSVLQCPIFGGLIDGLQEVASKLYSPTAQELLEFTMNPQLAEGVSSCTRKLLPNLELPTALVVGTGMSHLEHKSS